MNDGFTDVPPASGSLDYTQQLTDLITYSEIIAGGVNEIIWIAKVFFGTLYHFWGLEGGS